MSIKLYRLVEPILQKWTLQQLRTFKSDLDSQGVEVKESVTRAIDELVDYRVKEMLKNRKLHAMFLFQSLKRKLDEGKRVRLGAA